MRNKEKREEITYNCRESMPDRHSGSEDQKVKGRSWIHLWMMTNSRFKKRQPCTMLHINTKRKPCTVYNVLKMKKSYSPTICHNIEKRKPCNYALIGTKDYLFEVIVLSKFMNQ